MMRSTVLSLSLQLVFPGETIILRHARKIGARLFYKFTLVNFSYWLIIQC
jgi:hypothetical protein